MTNYIILTINEAFLGVVLTIFLIFVLWWSIINLINVNQNTRIRNEKRRAEIKALPYKKKYDELISKEKYKEAIAFGKLHKAHLVNSCYYW